MRWRPRRRGEPQRPPDDQDTFDLGEPAALWAARIFARRGWSARRLTATFGISEDEAHELITQAGSPQTAETDTTDSS